MDEHQFIKGEKGDFIEQFMIIVKLGDWCWEMISGFD